MAIKEITLLSYIQNLLDLVKQYGNLELKFTQPPSLKEVSTNIAYLYNDTITIYQGYLCEQVLSRTEFYWKYLHKICFYLSDTQRYELLTTLFKYDNVPLIAMFKRGEGKTELSLIEIIYRMINLENQHIIYYSPEFIISKIFLHNILLDIERLGYKISYHNDHSIILENGNIFEVQQLFSNNKLRGKRPTFLVYDDVLVMKRTKAVYERFIHQVLTESLPNLRPKMYGGGQLLILGTPDNDESYLVKLAQLRGSNYINTTDIII